MQVRKTAAGALVVLSLDHHHHHHNRHADIPKQVKLVFWLFFFHCGALHLPGTRRVGHWRPAAVRKSLCIFLAASARLVHLFQLVAGFLARLKVISWLFPGFVPDSRLPSDFLIS
jgi:hypothetical protein